MGRSEEKRDPSMGSSMAYGKKKTELKTFKAVGERKYIWRYMQN
jgi:hypothetical protein